MTTLHKYLGEEPIKVNDFVLSEMLELWQECDNCKARDRGHAFMSYKKKHYCLDCAKIKKEEESEMEKQKALREKRIAEYELKGLSQEEAIFLVDRDNPIKKDNRGGKKGTRIKHSAEHINRLKLVNQLRKINGISLKNAWALYHGNPQNSYKEVLNEH